MANESNLIKYVKGQSGNPNGRPRKYVSLLKEHGYKLSEINDCIQVMLALTIDEVNEILNDEKATVLEKTIANAMRHSLKKGSLYSMETLLSRVFGKPKEQMEQKNINAYTGKIEVQVIHSNIPLNFRETDIELNRNVLNN